LNTISLFYPLLNLTRFGSLCLFSNVFFAALVPFFWIQRKTLEVVWIVAWTRSGGRRIGPDIAGKK
jgi:hypothetical protein